MEEYISTLTYFFYAFTGAFFLIHFTIILGRSRNSDLPENIGTVISSIVFWLIVYVGPYLFLTRVIVNNIAATVITTLIVIVLTIWATIEEGSKDSPNRGIVNLKGSVKDWAEDYLRYTDKIKYLKEQYKKQTS